MGGYVNKSIQINEYNNILIFNYFKKFFSNHNKYMPSFLVSIHITQKFAILFIFTI